MGLKLKESDHQAVVVEYFKRQHPRLAGCIWANLNEQSFLSLLPLKMRFKILAFLKKIGMKKGVTDLTIAVPAGGKHGLFIEMKRDVGGVISEAQLEHINLMSSMGYEAVACHGSNAAIGVIRSYMTGYQG